MHCNRNRRCCLSGWSPQKNLGPFDVGTIILYAHTLRYLFRENFDGIVFTFYCDRSKPKNFVFGIDYGGHLVDERRW